MSNRGGMAGHESARARVGSDDWISPQHVLFGLGTLEMPFALDPCASLSQPWPTAKEAYTVMDNGLAKEWRGEVWLNPPYSNATPFMARLADHRNGMALIFARTETDMWFKYVWPCANAILFLRGRLAFHLPNGTVLGNAGAPSVLISYGNVSRMRLLHRNEKLLPGQLVLL